MNKNFMRAIVASAIGATVLTPVAYGQTASTLADQGEHCQALQTLAEEDRDRLRPEWIDESRSVVQAGDEARCETYYEQANEALGPNAAQMDREAAARIVVTQPDPQVNVQQRAPLVSVTQQEPRVQVNQGRPEIIVRQAPPNVRVQIPQPIITIDQPQPEIIVRMPDPDIAVTNPEPQVEVRQQPPEVNVTQPEPQVSVQAEQAMSQGDEDDSNVDLHRQEPRVEVQSTGNEAQIDVQRQEPSVDYQEAEPNVQVERQGEPEVRYNRTGEPTIRFEDPAGDQRGDMSQDTTNAGTRAEGMDEQQAQAGDVQQPNPTPAPGDLAQTSAPSLYQVLGQNQQMDAGEPVEYYAGDLEGRDVRNAQDQPLGTVDRVVLYNDRHYLVLADGEVVGIAEREVAIPLETVSVIDGGLVLRGMSEQDIQQMPDVSGQNTEQLTGQDRVEIGTP